MSSMKNDFFSRTFKSHESIAGIGAIIVKKLAFYRF